MKVCVSVKGRFHGFYLAEQLQKVGYLRKLITTYPKFEATKYGIQKELIDSLLLNECLERAWRKLPNKIKTLYSTQYFFHELFDSRAKSHVPLDIDLLVGWSSSMLHTMRYVRKKSSSAKIVLERGSSHIQYQHDILQEEYQRWGLKPPITHHPKVIQKELTEYSEADFISVPSVFVKNTMLQKGIPAEKIIQVPYGVNLTRFKPRPKEDKKFRVLFCGNRSIRKGVPYLLKAFAELNLPDAELWFIGSQDRDIDLFVKQYASPNIKYMGPFPEFELAKYYSQCSIFCLPSIEEGLAMVQPQVMACGLPVICTTNTGGGDIVRDGKDGFVLPIRNIDLLKEKMLLFYENPDLVKSMGESAQQRVSEGFTWDDYGRKMITEYQRILGKD